MDIRNYTWAHSFETKNKPRKLLIIITIVGITFAIIITFGGFLIYKKRNPRGFSKTPDNSYAGKANNRKE
jgi:hypothetical protein